jgi:hypothetical protein
MQATNTSTCKEANDSAENILDADYFGIVDALSINEKWQELRQ